MSISTLIYRSAILLRAKLYKSGLFSSRRLPGGKVISVGGLQVGGSGKSPVVVQLCRELLEEGFTPAILTRGYRGGLGLRGKLLLLGGEICARRDTPGGVLLRPDEALMQSHLLPHTPVLVGGRRWEVAQWALSLGLREPTHWVLDDGFQHWPLMRDQDVVCLDAQAPFGIPPGELLPQGRLRESPEALKRCHRVLFTRCQRGLPTHEHVTQVKRFGGADCDIAYSRYITHPPHQVVGRRWISVPWNQVLQKEGWVVSGLAGNEQFLKAVQKLGFQHVSPLFLEDHGALPNLSFLKKKTRNAAFVITTLKDFMRGWHLFQALDCPVWVCRGEIVWETE